MLTQQHVRYFKTQMMLFLIPFLSVLQTPLPLWAQQSQTPEQRLQALGLTLPEPARPVANFVTAVRTGNLIFLAGHGPCGAPTENRQFGS